MAAMTNFEGGHGLRGVSTNTPTSTLPTAPLERA
jgi:hypothetical protein